MRLILLAEIVFDYSFYIRGNVGTLRVTYMREALRAGHKFPPLLIDAKSKRCIDGFGRAAMYKAEKIEKVEVVEKHYKNEGEMLRDAVRYNADHGSPLTPCDRTRCLLLAERMGITVEQVAADLHVMPESLGVLRANRVGTLRSSVQADGSRGPIEIPLKRTLSHMAGKSLTKAQSEANDRLSGMNQQFYVNQVILLMENGLLDAEDEKLMERLGRLQELLDGLLVTK